MQFHAGNVIETLDDMQAENRLFIAGPKHSIGKENWGILNRLCTLLRMFRMMLKCGDFLLQNRPLSTHLCRTLWLCSASSVTCVGPTHPERLQAQPSNNCHFPASNCNYRMIILDPVDADNENQTPGRTIIFSVFRCIPESRPLRSVWFYAILKSSCRCPIVFTCDAYIDQNAQADSSRAACRRVFTAFPPLH
jgi:hypothetical protein